MTATTKKEMSTTKVVTNHYHSGLEFNEKAIEFMSQKGLDWDNARDGEDLSLRTNPVLVECVEVLGDTAHDEYQNIVIKEIPVDYDWEMTYHDDFYYESVDLVVKKSVLDKFVQSGDTEGLVAYLRGARYSVNE